MNLTSAKRNIYYPLEFSIAKIAVTANSQVTFDCYFKKAGTGVAGGLRCKYGQIAWLDGTNDIVVTCPNNTSRNKVTLQFTPTESGIVEIEALLWNVSIYGQSIIIDDISVSQE